MQPKPEKPKATGEAKKSTSGAEARIAPDVSAKMHFYAVRNEGDQLRWASAPRTSKKPDRMVGR